MGSFAVILPAAGRSSRFGDPVQKKIYAELDGRAIWIRAVEPFLTRPDVSQTILAIHPEDREVFERRYRANVAFMDIRVIDGGVERHDTVARALELVDPDCEFVAVHDAARPCLTPQLVDAVFAAAREYGAALPGLAVADTLKRVDAEGFIDATVARAGLYAVQTPQAFRREWLVRAYAERSRHPEVITDDAQLVEAIGHRCKIVDGSRFNLKITTAEDLHVAHAYLQVMTRPHGHASRHPYADEGRMWGEPESDRIR